MPITQSAKKALRQSRKRYAHNQTIKTAIKTEIKRLKKLVAEKNAAAKEHLPRVYQALDKGAKVNVITRNTAARLKSRLTRMLNKVSQ